MQDGVVETSGGKLRAGRRRDVYSFKGVPYGTADRFQSPRPAAWPGVRDALEVGPRSPQNEPPTTLPYLTWLRDPAPQAEHCLVLNVFTPSLDDSLRLPVMVYLHGGGFAVSSAGSPGVNGSNLARQGVVVVAVNHRLNLFGHLHLGSGADERERNSGNAGMLDLVAALEWVQTNITRFGGDPANVTIFGQSGGGSKVAVLMAMPRARGLFHKAIIQSASSLLRMATVEEAERNTHFLMASLGLGGTQLARLRDLPVQDLLAAMPAAIQAAGGIDDFRPIVDGTTLPCQPFEPAAMQTAAGIPLVIGWCENEQRLAFAPKPEIYRQTEDRALAATSQALGVDEPAAAPLIAAYRGSRPGDTAGDLYAQVYGDHRYRRNVTRAAELRVSGNAAPSYMYLLDWKSPVLGGLLRAPHTLCIAFAFGNADLATGITGGEPDRYALQGQMSAAWVSFARTGDPNHSGLPDWLPYSLPRRPTMIFGRHTRLVDDPLAAERIALTPFPSYRPAVAEGRLRAR